MCRVCAGARSLTLEMSGNLAFHVAIFPSCALPVLKIHDGVVQTRYFQQLGL
jgi:hypothetical protein